MERDRSNADGVPIWLCGRSFGDRKPVILTRIREVDIDGIAAGRHEVVYGDCEGVHGTDTAVI